MQNIPQWFTASPLRYLRVVPLTMLPQASWALKVRVSNQTHQSVFCRYRKFSFTTQVYFGFGSLYYDCRDETGRHGKREYITLTFAVLMLFPVGMLFINGDSEFLKTLSEEHHRVAFLLAQALFTWTVTCGSMGMVRSLLHQDRKSLQHISDPSYWLYLAHMPQVPILQFIVRDWALPALLKFTLVCGVTTISLLISYQHCVRYTWLGNLLNGPRNAPNPSSRQLLPAAMSRVPIPIRWAK